MQLVFWEPVEEACASDEDHGTEGVVRNTLALGAEYLVAADLALAGFNCFMSAAGLPFDLVVEAPNGLQRVQVKSTLGVRTESKGEEGRPEKRFRIGYIFDGKNYKCGRGGLNSYIGQADIFAFVALDIRRVMYGRVGQTPTRMIIKPNSFSSEACLLSLKTAIGAD